MAQKGFIFDWTKQLGFRENPFQEGVGKYVDDLYSGYSKERQKLNLFILEKYPFGTIKGDEGAGKTTTLKWMKSQLKNHEDRVRVSFIDASSLQKERDLIEALVDPVLNIYEKTVKKVQNKIRLEELGKFFYTKLKGGQTLVILLDNVGDLPKRYIPLFKYFFDNKIRIQLIAAGKPSEMSQDGILQVNSTDSLKLSLGGFTYEEAEDMMKKRIRFYGQEGIFPFKENMLRKIYEKSEGNPAQMLKLAREKAIKLALDNEYIAREKELLEEEREERDLEEESRPGVISIKLGKKDREELDFEPVEAPEETEQKKMLEELSEEDKKSEKDSDKEEKEKDGKEDKPKKKSRKERRKEMKEAKETERILAQLAKEFDKD